MNIDEAFLRLSSPLVSLRCTRQSSSFLLQGYFSAFSHSLCDTGHCLAFLFVLLYLLKEYVGSVKIDMQIIVEFLFTKSPMNFATLGPLGPMRAT